MWGSPTRRVITFAAENRDIGAIQEFASFDLVGVYAGPLQNADDRGPEPPLLQDGRVFRLLISDISDGLKLEMGTS